MSDIGMKIFGMRPAEKMTEQMAARMGKAITMSVGPEAQLLRRVMVEGLRNQSPGGKRILPLKPMTIAMRKLPRKSSKTGKGRRGSTKALIDNGDLIGSINAKQEQPGWWTVGVHRSARSKSGTSMVNIALIHEKGTRAFTITVTPKMHRFSIFLMIQGVLHAPWPVGKKLNMKIPARPFLEPAYKEWEQDSEKRMNLRVAKSLGLHGEYLAEIAEGGGLF